MTRADYIKKYIVDVLQDSIPDLAYEYQDSTQNLGYIDVDWEEEEAKMQHEVEKLIQKLGVPDDY